MKTVGSSHEHLRDEIQMLLAELLGQYAVPKKAAISTKTKRCYYYAKLGCRCSDSCKQSWTARLQCSEGNPNVLRVIAPDAAHETLLMEASTSLRGRAPELFSAPQRWETSGAPPPRLPPPAPAEAEAANEEERDAALPELKLQKHASISDRQFDLLRNKILADGVIPTTGEFCELCHDAGCPLPLESHAKTKLKMYLQRARKKNPAYVADPLSNSIALLEHCRTLLADLTAEDPYRLVTLSNLQADPKHRFLFIPFTCQAFISAAAKCRDEGICLAVDGKWCILSRGAVNLDKQNEGQKSKAKRSRAKPDKTKPSESEAEGRTTLKAPENEKRWGA